MRRKKRTKPLTKGSTTKGSTTEKKEDDRIHGLHLFEVEFWRFLLVGLATLTIILLSSSIREYSWTHGLVAVEDSWWEYTKVYLYMMMAGTIYAGTYTTLQAQWWWIQSVLLVMIPVVGSLVFLIINEHVIQTMAMNIILMVGMISTFTICSFLLYYYVFQTMCPSGEKDHDECENRPRLHFILLSTVVFVTLLIFSYIPPSSQGLFAPHAFDDDLLDTSRWYMNNHVTQT
jgi:hypothetical protein